MLRSRLNPALTPPARTIYHRHEFRLIATSGPVWHRLMAWDAHTE